MKNLKSIQIKLSIYDLIVKSNIVAKIYLDPFFATQSLAMYYSQISKHIDVFLTKTSKQLEICSIKMKEIKELPSKTIKGHKIFQKMGSDLRYKWHHWFVKFHLNQTYGSYTKEIQNSVSSDLKIICFPKNYILLIYFTKKQIWKKKQK